MELPCEGEALAVEARGPLQLPCGVAFAAPQHYLRHFLVLMFFLYTPLPLQSTLRALVPAVTVQQQHNGKNQLRGATSGAKPAHGDPVAHWRKRFSSRALMAALSVEVEAADGLWAAGGSLSVQEASKADVGAQGRLEG